MIKTEIGILKQTEMKLVVPWMKLVTGVFFLLLSYKWTNRVKMCEIRGNQAWVDCHRVKRRRMLKSSRHIQPLYLTHMMNIFFSSFFFNLFTSHLKIWRMTMEKELTVNVSCSEMQWLWQVETWYKLDWQIYTYIYIYIFERCVYEN